MKTRYEYKRAKLTLARFEQSLKANGHHFAPDSKTFALGGAAIAASLTPAIAHADNAGLARLAQSVSERVEAIQAAGTIDAARAGYQSLMNDIAGIHQAAFDLVDFQLKGEPTTDDLFSFTQPFQTALQSIGLG